MQQQEEPAFEQQEREQAFEAQTLAQQERAIEAHAVEAVEEQEPQAAEEEQQEPAVEAQALEEQDESTRQEFESRAQSVLLQLSELDVHAVASQARQTACWQRQRPEGAREWSSGDGSGSVNASKHTGQSPSASGVAHGRTAGARG